MKPMTFLRALLFTIFPTLIFALFFWKAMPIIDWFGKPLLYSFPSGTGFVAFQWMALALVLFRREKNKSGTFGERFRFRSLDSASWRTILALAVVLMGLEYLSAPVVQWIQENHVAPPKYFFRLMDSDPMYFMEVQTHGNWMTPAIFLSFTFFYMFCQELWFRGLMLPRQELFHGNKAWIVNGFLFALFLCILPWHAAAAIPGAFAIAYSAHRSKNTWVPLIARVLATAPVFFRIFEGVLHS